MALSNRRKLTLSALLFLAAPLLAELATRVRAHIKYGRYQSVYDLYEPHPDVDLLVPKPGLSITFARRSQIDIDSRGFRNPELDQPRPPTRMRMAFLGGSTTFCGQASSNETTWPHLLLERLRGQFGECEFDYVNAGVTGSSVQSSRLSLEHRLQPLDPNVVVIYHAAKDLADDTRVLAMKNGLVPDQPHDKLEDYSLLWTLLRMNWWHFKSQQAGRSSEGKLNYDAAELALGFESQLTALVREAQASADLVVLITFATKVRREQSEQQQLENLAQAFTFTPYLRPQGILDGYDAYNDAVRRVAHATGAVLIDEVHRIPGDEQHFSDSVHFTEAGYRAMASRVFDGLITSEPFLALRSRICAPDGIDRKGELPTHAASTELR